MYYEVYALLLAIVKCHYFFRFKNDGEGSSACETLSESELKIITLKNFSCFVSTGSAVTNDNDLDATLNVLGMDIGSSHTTSSQQQRTTCNYCIGWRG